jgi:hypothetical protein
MAGRIKEDYYVPSGVAILGLDLAARDVEHGAIGKDPAAVSNHSLEAAIRVVPGQLISLERIGLGTAGNLGTSTRLLNVLKPLVYYRIRVCGPLPVIPSVGIVAGSQGKQEQQCNAAFSHGDLLVGVSTSLDMMHPFGIHTSPL